MLSWVNLNYRGKTITLKEAEAISGLSGSTIRERILMRGMTVEEAIETPRITTRKPRVYLDYHGRKITYKEAAELSGMAYTTIIQRMRLEGMTAEEAIETPKRINSHPRALLDYHGKKVSYGEASALSGLSRGTIWMRIHHQGMTVEEAIETPKRTEKRGCNE